MKRKWKILTSFFALVLLGSAICFFTVCSHRPNPIPPDSVILYSIDGHFDDRNIGADVDPRDGLSPDQLYYGFPILGQVDLTGTDTGKELTDILEVQRHRLDRSRARCFWPRHGLRVTRGGVTTDYLICFECVQFRWHNNGSQQHADDHHIPETYRDAFTAPLIDAGIELAP